MTVKGPDDEDYEDFLHDWEKRQKELLHELLKALESNMNEDELQELVNTVVKHYVFYYDSKDSAARQSILETITPPWKTSLEKAFMWIGGWRPTMTFQLAYAQIGEMIEQELADILEGIEIPSMAGISCKQLESIDTLQRQTQKEEERLSHRMAILQQSMADQPLLGLAEKLDSVELPAEKEDAAAPLENAVDNKLDAMKDILIEADRLRKDTLLKMLNILTAFQSAQYLAAATRLQIALRKVGEVQDRKVIQTDDVR